MGWEIERDDLLNQSGKVPNLVAGIHFQVAFMIVFDLLMKPQPSEHVSEHQPG